MSHKRVWRDVTFNRSELICSWNQSVPSINDRSDPPSQRYTRKLKSIRNNFPRLEEARDTRDGFTVLGGFTVIAHVIRWRRRRMSSISSRPRDLWFYSENHDTKTAEFNLDPGRSRRWRSRRQQKSVTRLDSSPDFYLYSRTTCPYDHLSSSTCNDSTCYGAWRENGKREKEKERGKKEPVPKFTDACISLGLFDREKKRTALVVRGIPRYNTGF